MKIKLEWLVKAYRFIKCNIADNPNPVGVRGHNGYYTARCDNCGAKCYFDSDGKWRHE